ncbi:MAG: helix-turn-helix domain-containing protein [Burkholderiaceae bacterium]|nr:helix-turn-helix domain-containing protein [Burkholderiaceae bacterium]
MTLQELIKAAADKYGNQGDLAEMLGVRRSRISEWKAGNHKPETSTIVRLAELADLPVMETVAEIEAQLHPEVAASWLSALGKLRAAGVAASVLAIVGTTMPANDAQASTLTGTTARLCIM